MNSFHLFYVLTRCTQWVQFRSSDGSILLYFDPATKQIWGEGSGGVTDSDMHVDGDQPGEGVTGNPPPAEEFSDDEINAAARVADLVSSLRIPVL